MNEHEIKDLIKSVFHDHPRIKILFNETKSGFKKRYGKLIDYSFEVARLSNGVFVSSNQQTVLLFYKTYKKKSLKTIFLYLKLLLVIKPSLIIAILKEEKIIKANGLKVSAYYYAWYLAQNDAYNKLDGLFEARNFLINKSKEDNIPILLETAKESLVNFYIKAGFELYTTVENNGVNIFFFKYIPNDLSN